MKMLSGLMSRCVMPRVCAAVRPLEIWRAMSRTAGTESADVERGAERVAFEELETRYGTPPSLPTSHRQGCSGG
jgi:hypothetical protein